MEFQYLLKITVKAMNDTMSEHSLVPSRLVFGIILRFSTVSTNLSFESNEGKQSEQLKQK